MNIMDRNETIRIANLITKNTIALSEALKVISEYCYEHNKNTKDIEQFLNIISSNNIILFYYLKYSLNYFKGKYMVYTLYNKEGNIIFNF